MALTTNHVNNEVIKFRKEVAYDFLRAGKLDAYTGKTTTSPIVLVSDLESGGKEINIPLVTQFTGNGVGVGTLRGNEEIIDSYGFPMWCDWYRNAFANNRAVNKESSFNVRSTARQMLRNWAKRIARDDMIDALLSIPTASIQAGRFQTPGNRVNGVKWANASTANKNSWVTANYDRVGFGNAIANYSSTFATAAGNVDSTNDRMTAEIGSLMKSQAQQTGVDPNNPGAYNGRPKINPWMIEGADNDEEWYLCLLGNYAFRDLKADPVMYQANRDARERESNPTKTNPLFTGGSLVYDGVIYLNIPEITQRLLLKGIGTSGIDVEPVFMLGAGAFAKAVGQMPRETQLEDGDYDFITGMGVEAQMGYAKIAKAPLAVNGATVGDLVDWGTVTWFVAGVANQ